LILPRSVKRGFFFSNKSTDFIYTSVIELTKGQTSEKIIVTLNELKTLNEPYYLFVFTHVTTKEVVNIIYAEGADESSYPERSNQFDINTQSVFGTKPVGQWNYTVYEQESDTNTDTENATGIVEYGKMILKPSTDFAYEEYNTTTTFKTYNG